MSDATSDTWARRASFSTEREHLAVTVEDGRIYAISGRWGPINTGLVEVYDPAADRWQTLASIPTPRSGIGSALLDGCIHVFGGEAFNSARVFPEHEVYAIGSDLWEPAPPMRTPRHGLAVVEVNGRIYTIGGITAAPSTITDLTELWAET